MSRAVNGNSNIEDLIAGQVLGDLTPQERKELFARQAEVDPTFVFELEQTAAAVQRMDSSTNSQSLPTSLADRIRQDADLYVGGASRQDLRSVGVVSNPEDLQPQQAAGASGREVFAWLCLAASLLFAVVLVTQQQMPNVIKLTSAEKRSALLTEAASPIQVDWSAGKTPFDNPVSGDVVWDNQRQEGYMRFVDMPVNDPTQEQYQLWIIDPARDDEPIDGGVFDIAAGGEVIVPIDAKLGVVDPQAFAITIEKPGGVVVSTQERLPLLAAVN